MSRRLPRHTVPVRTATLAWIVACALALALAVPSYAAGGASAQSGQSGRSARPNVFLIVIDTLRADHLSAYGYERETSPHLDRLASEGTLYERTIADAPWTLPSHASLFTGLFVRDHDTQSNHLTLDERYETLAERLTAAGYHTGGFSNNVWTNPTSGLEQGFQTFEELWREQPSRGEGISRDVPTEDMGADLANRKIFSWLDGLEDDEPFFVFINYFEPHLPYRPTEPFDDDFLPEGIDEGTVRRLRSFYSPREYGYILHVPWMKVSDRDLQVLTSLYDGEIAYVDSKIGELVAGLRKRGLADDTVLVITSDHGEHLGEHHMLGHKFSVYEPLLHVPLIVWGPGHIPAGRRVATPVQSHRIYGTVLDLAGLRDPERPSDRPLPVEDEESPGFTFSQLAYPKIFLDVAKRKIPGCKTDAFERALDTVRGPQYKLISGSDGSEELYDLQEDPGETKNLAGSQPKVLERLRTALVEFLRGS